MTIWLTSGYPVENMEISDVGRKYNEKELIESTVFYISASISLWSDGLESVHGCTAVLRLRRLRVV